MPVVITPGILLPNGRFLPRLGDGHAKTAIRFCEQYSNLYDLMLSASREFEPDEFMVMSGCIIVAGYNGTPCVKIAQNNEQANIKETIQEYEKNKYQIWPYWEINPEYEKALKDVLENTVKMQIIIRR